MPNSHAQIWIHSIWVTKKRLPLINKKWKIDLCKHIKENAKSKGYHVDHINGIENHLHLLIKMHPTQNISTMMQNLKGEASFWINLNELMEDGSRFRWQDGYAALSVSPDRVKVVRNYIKNQEKHHSKIDLEKELELYF